MHRSVWLWGCALFVGSCGTEHGELSTAGSAPIINGTATTGDPAVPLVRHHGFDGVNHYYSNCSSSLISPKIVLTAAHCIESAASGDKVEVYFGSDVDEDESTARWVEAERYFMHPAYDTRPDHFFDGPDAAIVVLEEPVHDIDPVAYRQTPLEDSDVGKDVRIVGFGNNNGFAGTGSGIKRQAWTTIHSLESRVVNIGGDGGGRTCQGDSGGPTFLEVDGVEETIGIASYGFPNCVSYGSKTRVGRIAEWITEQIHTYDDCTPACDGKTCGNDGCGGSCGTCDDGDICNADGVCEVCVPACDGRSCGDDGCGGSCGVCAEGEQCADDGQCYACVPVCGGRSCGDDGCGGTCGTCGTEELCTDDGQCVAEPETSACDENGGWESEPNDGVADASGFCVSGLVYGSIATAGDVDWYRASFATSSASVTLAVGEGSYGVTLYRVVDGAVEEVDAAVVSSAPDSATVSATVSGSHLVRVERTDGGSSWSWAYSLQIH